MSLAEVSAGSDLPNSFNVIIEIAANASPTKYEVDKDSGLLVVDRFMPTAMFYPANYGYIPSTLSNDGDPADVLLITPSDIQGGCLVKARAIGMLRMTDESGEDCKILAVPTVKSCVEYAHINSLEDVSPVLLKRIVHFFEHYKGLEEGKWVKIDGWEDAASAHKEIMDSVARYTS